LRRTFLSVLSALLTGITGAAARVPPDMAFE
jgi:hypothetical protein